MKIGNIALPTSATNNSPTEKILNVFEKGMNYISFKAHAEFGQLSLGRPGVVH